MATFPLRKGSQGPEVKLLAEVAVRRFASYAKEFDGSPLKADGYFGLGEEAFVRNWQGRSKLPVTGILSEAQYLSIIGKGGPQNGGGTVVIGRRKIWMITAPGSGANWDQGPSFQLGLRVERELKINHQPLYFQKGGYLGFMGGDPKFSYVDVTWDQYLSLKHNLEQNPDINDPAFELWLSGYSQSADGMEDAVEMLFGDGGFVHPGDPTQTPAAPGPYRHLRSRINGVIQFGNPSTERTGIARKVRPPWLAALIRNVNYPNDFYAVATDSIRPPMYAVIIKAEMELPFFVHVMKIAMKVIAGMVPIFGGILGPLGPTVVAGMAGISALTPMLGGLMGQASAADEQVDRDLEEMFSITGLIKNVPAIISLVGALPGLQAHGGYEFDPAMMQRSYDVVAGYRR